MIGRVREATNPTALAVNGIPVLSLSIQAMPKSSTGTAVAATGRHGLHRSPPTRSP
jgi:hypothetical protein